MVGGILSRDGKSMIPFELRLCFGSIQPSRIQLLLCLPRQFCDVGLFLCLQHLPSAFCNLGLYIGLHGTAQSKPRDTGAATSQVVGWLAGRIAGWLRSNTLRVCLDEFRHLLLRYDSLLRLSFCFTGLRFHLAVVFEMSLLW